jgi:hypothetical protein
MAGATKIVASTMTAKTIRIHSLPMEADAAPC